MVLIYTMPEQNLEKTVACLLLNPDSTTAGENQ